MSDLVVATLKTINEDRSGNLWVAVQGVTVRGEPGPVKRLELSHFDGTSQRLIRKAGAGELPKKRQVMLWPGHGLCFLKA